MKPDPIHFGLFTGGGCGGALTNVSVSLASGMALHGHTVDMVTLNTDKDALTRFYSHVEGISKVNVYRLGVQHTRTCLRRLVKYYRAHKPDVMFSQLTYTNAFAVIAKFLSFTRSVNILLEGTLVSKVGEEDAKYDPKLRLVPWLVKFVYPHADGLIAKSHDVLRDVREIIGNRLDGIKIRVLPNPYNVEGIRSLAKEPVDHHWLAGNKVPVILSAGRLVEPKAFDILISAFAGVVREMACRLIILGVGPERAKLEALARKLGVAHHMDMPGWVANPWKYMWRASFFVLPSRYEGWPSAVTEAMICGVPVITTDCPGGGREMVENEKNGLIVPMDDVDVLKQGMLRLLNDSKLRVMLGANAYKRSEKYDYRIVAQDYICFARWVLEKS